jgi:hypothetical protein
LFSIKILYYGNYSRLRDIFEDLVSGFLDMQLPYRIYLVPVNETSWISHENRCKQYLLVREKLHVIKRSLCIVPFVPFGCSSSPRWLSVHSTVTSQHQKKAAWPEPVKANWRKQNKQLFFCTSLLIFTRSVPLSRALRIHNAASFRYTPRATFTHDFNGTCLPPYIFLAVAPSRSHRGGSAHNLQLTIGVEDYLFFIHTYLLVAMP